MIFSQNENKENEQFFSPPKEPLYPTKHLDDINELISSNNFDLNLSKLNTKLSFLGLPSPMIMTYSPSNLCILDCLFRLVTQKEVFIFFKH